MSMAIEWIVASYVKVKNRQALLQLLEHRRKVLADLRAVNSIDPTNAVQIVEDELVAIEAGLEELKSPPGALPGNE